jgi:ABC-2 type transport system ATP-binding protein
VADNVPPKEIVLRTQNISKSYGDMDAIVDLSFEMRAGEIVGLLGPNGAGKTTTIRVLSTILRQTRGDFTILGIPSSKAKDIRSLIGVLPESLGFPNYMTGEEYLIYIGRLYGQSKESARDKAALLLDTLGMKSRSKNRIKIYSLGMRQRLGIARAMVNDPKILFLDEPTLGFDPQGQIEMLQIIHDAAELNHVAVLLCSHLLEVVDQICTKILILKDGHVIAEGSISDIKQRVSVPLAYRIQVPSKDAPKALSLLADLDGIVAEINSSKKDEIVVSIHEGGVSINKNDILRNLIQADIPIEAFSMDSVRLSDAFMSMIEEERL